MAIKVEGARVELTGRDAQRFLGQIAEGNPNSDAAIKRGRELAKKFLRDGFVNFTPPSRHAVATPPPPKK